VERRIENPLSKRILAGEFGDGDHVVVDHQGSDFVFTKGVRPEAREPVAATAS
jgi:ATP-dependent Clp protease ATP-binding subunit ClpA